MTEQSLDLPAIELVTESSWISGRLARDLASDAANLESRLNLSEYSLSGRSLIESGRLVDVLNREGGYITVSGARIQPLFPIELLDRNADAVAVNVTEILCAAPLRPDAVQPPSPPQGSAPPPGRSDRERREVALQVGPILVQGDLHVMPGSDPVPAYFHGDRAFVPLTNATGIYLPEPNRKWVREVLIINMRRTQMLIASPAREDDQSQ
jgi:hypothetical protein